MADGARAREQAREILSDGRYHETNVPRPFKGVLGWAGDRLDDAGRWIAGLFDDVDGAVPGGSGVTWVLLAALVAVAAVFVARAEVRRRTAAAAGRAAEAVPEELDPRALERAAEAAEGAGDFERAVRLRFRAGALRLDAEAQTTSTIAERLHSPVFDRLGDDHDAIAYGGRAAEADDAAAAREGWREVLR